jgi:hypothetical protein
MKLTLTFLALLTGLLTSRPSPAQKQVVSARAGLVSRAEGEVLYHRHEKGEGVGQLRGGVKLHDGERVFTAETGRVTWSLTPESYMIGSADCSSKVRRCP